MESDKNFDISLNKNITKLITRGLVAIYIIYLAVNILTSGFSSDQGPLLTILGIIFLIAGVAFMVYAIREFIVSRRSNEEPKDN